MAYSFDTRRLFETAIPLKTSPVSTRRLARRNQRRMRRIVRAV